MKRLIFSLLAAASVAMLPGCLEETEPESCSTPEITELNYLPRSPKATDEVTVTAKIKNEHCPFQAQITYQVADVGEDWSNSADSYQSTTPVHSTTAGETYEFEGTIPPAGRSNCKVRFVIEVVTQHLYYIASEPQEYLVLGDDAGGSE